MSDIVRGTRQRGALVSALLPDNVILTPKKSNCLQNVPYRFLGYLTSGEGAFIKMCLPLEMPEIKDMDPIMIEIHAKKIEIGGTFDLPGFPKTYGELGEKTRRQAVYDERIKVLAKEVREVWTRLLDPESRSGEIDRLAELLGQSPRNMRDILKRVWVAAGDALGYAPAYGDCGRGERFDCKVGAKPKRKEFTSRNPGELALSKEDKEKMSEHIRRSWRPNVNSLEECHQAYQIEAYGNGGEELDYSTQMPSLNQYRRLADLINKDGELERLALGDVDYRRKYKTYPGVHNHRVTAPNSVYIIDWTVLQIKVVSRLDRTQTILPATLYLVIDLWSSCIVGIYVCLAKTPSWADAKVALIYAFSEKKPLCDRLGIPEKFSKTWTCNFLPRKILCDRGELVNKNTVEIPKGLEGILEFAEAEDPDTKAQIERMVRTTKQNLRRMLPGMWRKKDEKTKLAEKASAALDIDQIFKQVALAVLKENQRAVQPHYIESALLKHVTSPDSKGFTPAISRIGVFNWGLKHAAGAVRQLSTPLIYDALLDSGKGEIGPKGLKFKSLVFYDADILTQGILNRAVRAKGLEVDVRFDRMDATRVWFRIDVADAWQPLPCTDDEVQRFHLSFDEHAERESAKRIAIDRTTTETVALRHQITKYAAGEVRVAKRQTQAAKRQSSVKRSKSNFVKGNLALGRVERAMVNAEVVEQVASPRSPAKVPQRSHESARVGSVDSLKARRRARVRQQGNSELRA